MTSSQPTTSLPIQQERLFLKSFNMTLNTNIRTEKMTAEKINEYEVEFRLKIASIMKRFHEMIPECHKQQVKNISSNGNPEIAKRTSCLHYHGVVDLTTTNKDIRLDYKKANQIAKEHQLYLNFRPLRNEREIALDYAYKDQDGVQSLNN